MTWTLLRLIDEFSLLLSESARFHSARPDGSGRSVAAVYDEALGLLLETRKRAFLASERAVVAVVGLGNVGKSTLLNALLGRDLVVRRNGPCTPAPIEFQSGPQPQVAAVYQDRFQRPRWVLSDLEAVREKLAELTQPEPDDRPSLLKKIIVDIPHPLLSSGLVLADTPGFGAAQAGAAAGSHDAAVRSYLQNEVTQVFWVVLADQGISGLEQRYSELFAEVCDDIIVTGSEDWNEHDRQRFRVRFAGALGNGPRGSARGKRPVFHFVSGLRGLAAREKGDSQGLEQAGIVHLEGRIRSLANAAGRMAAAEDGVRQLAEDLRTWLSEHRDARGFRLRPWWRPDSFSRWRSLRCDLPIHADLVALLAENPPPPRPPHSGFGANS